MPSNAAATTTTTFKTSDFEYDAAANKMRDTAGKLSGNSQTMSRSRLTQGEEPATTQHVCQSLGFSSLFLYVLC
ncbi:hypothetical protein JZ751_005263 [Albula glossodonta]|uniref:Uncharacterized protein n=1 Tax=Albula glossodonta TaxID=121402 RepID=A0A8T2P5X7_9TELE|nr:hypothetical protein JZ751_005263 [Albula glossodonta]